MSVDIDVAGNYHGTRFFVFCEVDEPREELFSGLRFVSHLADAMVTIIFPSQTDTDALTERFTTSSFQGNSRSNSCPGWGESLTRSRRRYPSSRFSAIAQG